MDECFAALAASWLELLLTRENLASFGVRRERVDQCHFALVP